MSVLLTCIVIAALVLMFIGAFVSNNNDDAKQLESVSPFILIGAIGLIFYNNVITTMDIVYYCVGVIIYIPIYWILYLRKIGHQIREELTLTDIEHLSYSLHEHTIRNDQGERIVDIQNPNPSKIIFNCLIFPISFVIIMLSDIIKTIIFRLTKIIDYIRKKISASVMKNIGK